MCQLGSNKSSTSLTTSQVVTVKAELTAGFLKTISKSTKGRQDLMPNENSYSKLVEAIDELTRENTFLKVKAQYFKQSCAAMDISLNVARAQIVELKQDMRVLKASAV